MPTSAVLRSPARLSLPAWLANCLILALILLLYPLNTLLEANLDPYYFHILGLIGINVVLAVSLNLINGITGQFSLGHAGFMAIGAYTAGSILNHYNPPAGAWYEPLALLGSLALGGLFAAIAGLAIGIPTLRLRGDYLAIATLGFGEIITILINNTEYVGPFKIGGAAGLHGIPIIHNLFWIYACVVVCVVAVWRIAYSTKGTAFLAVRNDEIAAGAMGVDVTYYKVAAFVIGSFFAGVAGGLYAIWFGNLDPSSFQFMKSVELVVMVVLGGSGSITGSIIAAVVLTYLPEQLRFLANWRLVIYALLLIIMMLVRPEGLLGSRELFRLRRKPPAPAAAPMTPGKVVT